MKLQKELDVKISPIEIGDRVYIETRRNTYMGGVVVAIPIIGSGNEKVEIELDNGRIVRKNIYKTIFYEEK